MNGWAAKVCLAFGLAWVGGSAAAACLDDAEREVLASWWRQTTPEQTNACVAAGMDPIEALGYAASFNQDVEVVKALIAAVPDDGFSSKMEFLFGKEGYWLSRALGYAAAYNQSAEVAHGLVAAGADVNARLPLSILVSGGGEGPDYEMDGTALHYALRLNGNAAVALALIHAGADPGKRDQWFNTPLHQAARYADDPAVVSALIAAGADVNARNNLGVPPSPFELNDTLGQTPLMLAACCNANPAIAAALISAGAQVRTHGGDLLATPLHYAAADNVPTVAQTLLQADAAVNAANLRVSGSWNNTENNENGYTPLHYAARDNEEPAVAALLIAAGAEVNAQTEDNATPLQLALDNPNPQVAETLVKAGARQ